MSAIIINPPAGRSITPSDNRIVFQVGADNGAVIAIDGEQDNIIGLKLENESSGTWDAVPPIGGEPYAFVRLPNISTEIITQILLANGVSPVPPLPYNVDKYKPVGCTITFSGLTANLTGTLVNIEDANLSWDVDINFENKVDWATWSGLGNTFASLPDYRPRNVLITNTDVAFIDDLIDQAPLNFNTGSIGGGLFYATWDNQGYEWLLQGGSEGIVTEGLLSADVVEFYGEPTSIPTTGFSGYANLKKLYLFAAIGSDSFVIGSNPALEEVYVNYTGNLDFEPVVFNCPNLTKMFLVNGDISGIASDAWDDLPLANITIRTQVANETNGTGSGPADVLQTLIAAGGTSLYHEETLVPVFPGAFMLASDELDYYTIDEANSTIDGTVGSLFEGISLTITNPEPTLPGLQTDVDFSVSAGFGTGFLFENFTRSIGVSFKITGSTSGSIFAGANDYFIRTTVFINGQQHSVHRIFTNAGDLAGFDVSPITSSVANRLTIPQIAFSLSENQGYIQLSAIPVIDGVEIGESVVSEPVDFFKARIDERRLAPWNYQDWSFKANNSTGKFLTDYPRTEERRIRKNGNYYIGGMWAKGTIEDVDRQIRVRYNDDSALPTLGFVRSSVETLVAGALGEYSAFISINLKESLWVNGTTLTQAEADAATSVQIDAVRFTEGASISGNDIITLTIWDGECNLGRTVHFLNKLGQMESFYFDREMDEGADVTGYKADLRSSTGYNLANDGLSEYLREANDTITLRTNWLSESVYNWLIKELTESPYILIEYDTIQVRAWVNESGWEKQTHQKNSVMRATFRFKLSETRYSPLV